MKTVPFTLLKLYRKKNIKRKPNINIYVAIFLIIIFSFSGKFEIHHTMICSKVTH